MMLSLAGSARSCLRYCLVAAIAAALLCTASGKASADDAAALSKFLPNDINAIAIVRMEDVLKTPRAVREDWAKSADEKFMTGAGGIPSWVRTLLVGFSVRPAMMEEVWAAGVASVPQDLSIEEISQRDGLVADSFGGMPVLRGRRNSYILGIQPGVIGIWRPAIRQEAARWARALEAKVTGPLSDYLGRASAQTGHLVMAIDLENTLDPANTRAHVAALEGLGNAAGSQEQLLSLLMSLQGVTLSATVGDATTGTLQIDFSENVGTLGPSVKAFFLNVLHELGGAIDDFDRATVQAAGKSVTLQASLSDESMRRLFSLITSSPTMNRMETPATAAPSVSPPAPQSPTQATASSRYFQQIDQYVNDLARANRRASDASRTALWHERFAAKIDDLSIADVDPALIQYGADVASKLRALARSLRGQHLEVNLQQKTLTYEQNFTPGWASVNVWGGVGYAPSAVNVTSNLQQVRERQAAAISAGAQQREEVWGMLADQRQQILRQMQQKFGPDFGGNAR